MQGTLGAMNTRSPGLYFFTEAPTANTSAPISCPCTSGARGRRYHSTISLPHMPQEITLTSISLRFGFGVGTFLIRISLLLYQYATFIFYFSESRRDRELFSEFRCHGRQPARPESWQPALRTEKCYVPCQHRRRLFERRYRPLSMHQAPESSCHQPLR